MNATTADLVTLLSEANLVIENARSWFGALTPTQLNWKPSAERWSVAQCFEHLLTTNKGYFPLIDDVLSGQKTKSVWQRVPIFPGIWGKLLVKSMDPTTKRKVKAPKKFQPSASDIGPTIIEDFTEQQLQLIASMKATEHLDVAKIIIPSPVTAVINYSLLDAYRLIVVHEQRHSLQAKRVTEENSFPH